jgi:hypothetical protein
VNPKQKGNAIASTMAGGQLPTFKPHLLSCNIGSQYLRPPLRIRLQNTQNHNLRNKQLLLAHGKHNENAPSTKPRSKLTHVFIRRHFVIPSRINNPVASLQFDYLQQTGSPLPRMARGLSLNVGSSRPCLRLSPNFGDCEFLGPSPTFSRFCA